MKILIISTTLFIFLIQSCSENRATDFSEGNHTVTVELSSTALFSGSENEIAPLQLWNKQTNNQSVTSLAKIAAKISFKQAYVISLNYAPYIKDYLTYNNDSTMNCLFLNSNSAAFTNRPLDNWDTLSAALHDFSMCTVNDIKTLEKDGD
ncbi:MAG: hypothetical protein JNL74_03585, partial [Fibrobacteres bacterium]|nr:hypothetical protein [Fibrobacterota bacterium]